MILVIVISILAHLRTPAFVLGLSALVIGCNETTPIKDDTPHAQIGADASFETGQNVESSEGLPSAGSRSVTQKVSEDIEENIWGRIHAGYQLSVTAPSAGQKRIDSLLKRYQRHPKGIVKQTENARLYIHYIVGELEKRGMPTELALLPFVESRYDPFAYSSGRASGLWQFIPSTGKHFGLKENWWLDERRDVIASTQKALHYLSYLHKHFKGDWLLAIAAYNAGEGTVGKAIIFNKYQKKPTDYWSLPLPTETKNYIPKLLAWKKLVNRPQDYGVQLTNIPNKPQFAALDIGSQIDLAKLADVSNIAIEQIYALNPAYNRWATDPDAPHQLLFPIDKVDEVKATLADYPPQERLQWHRYTIKPNDSLSRIAKHYNTTTASIKSINQLKSSRIRVGKTLLIPIASKASTYYESSAEQRLSQRQNKYARKNKQRIEHHVVSGDTLWSISKQYQVSTSEIAKWNNMSPKDILRNQQKLVIWSTQSSSTQKTASRSSSVVRKVIYQVKKGESLSVISHRFNVAIKDIRQWNKLANKKYIQPGQTLRLFVSMADQAKKF